MKTNCLDESGKIKFTMEFEVESRLPYLDAVLTLVKGEVKFGVYEKPYSARMLLNYSSYQDEGIKRGIIAGETLRYLRISDEFEHDFKDLKRKFIENDYPMKEVNKVVAATKKKWESRKQAKEEKDKVYLSVDYPGKKKAREIKKLGRKYGFKPAFKRNLTLGNKLSRNWKHKTNRNKGLIYSIRCRCGDEYVGETGKDLETRIKGHKYSIRTLDANNGLAVHYMSCNAGFDWEGVETLGWEGKWGSRKIKESLWIQRRKPKMNLNEGWKIRGRWN